MNAGQRPSKGNELCCLQETRFSSGLTSCHVGQVKAVGQGFRSSPLGADHHVVSWLVPEVVPKRRRLPGVLPVTHHLKGLAVQQDEAP